MTRTYSDKQVADILGRAAELSAKEGPATGATLDDLQRIAVEAGLDPAAVRRAAAEIDRGGAMATKVNPFLGERTNAVFETRISGELADGVHERLAEILRARYPAGQASVVGRTFTWQVARPLPGRQQSSERMTVTITSRDGATSLRVEETFHMMARRTVSSSVAFAIALTMIGVTSFVAGPLLVGGLIAAGALGGFGVGRTLFGFKARARERELQSLFNELCEAIETLPAPASAATSAFAMSASASPSTSASAEGIVAVAQLEDLAALRARSLGAAPPAQETEQEVEVATEETVPAGRR